VLTDRPYDWQGSFVLPKKAGIRGVTSRTRVSIDLIPAIRIVLSGGSWLGSEVVHTPEDDDIAKTRDFRGFRNLLERI
jgi:hypothetical protein